MGWKPGVGSPGRPIALDDEGCDRCPHNQHRSCGDRGNVPSTPQWWRMHRCPPSRCHLRFERPGEWAIDGGHPEQPPFPRNSLEDVAPSVFEREISWGQDVLEATGHRYL